jgi:hypothetical protein
METAKPIQATFVSTDLIESSLQDGNALLSWLTREPRGYSVSNITGGSGKGYTQLPRALLNRNLSRRKRPGDRAILHSYTDQRA